MSTAADYVPSSRRPHHAAAGARGCRGCDLYRDATQTVFGEGPTAAELMLVGETDECVECRR